MINIFGWKNIVIFYTNDTYGIPAYSVIYNKAEYYGYRIVNDAQYRVLPPITSNDSLGNYTENLKDALSTGCNLFFLAMSDPSAFFLLEELYNLGVRRGDLTYFFFVSTGLDALKTSGGNSTKRAELMHGSFLVYSASYHGAYGNKLKTEYLSYYNDS